MTRSAVKRLLGLHQRALNRHDVSALLAFYAEDAVVLSPMFDKLQGRAAIGTAFERLFATFPGYRAEVREALFLHDGDRAAEFSRVHARHDVEVFGLPPTGQAIEYQAARLFTFRDGLIVFERRIYDFAGMLDRLEKARVDRELALASAVQRALLGHPARRGAHYAAAGASLPSRAICGDFFDYLDLPAGGVGIALGDISGKGPAAALVAAMLEGMFAIVASEGDGPSRTLARLNQALCHRGIESGFATAVYGMLLPDGRFTYAGAGHNPPLLLRASEVVQLDSGGPPLGVFDAAQFPEATEALLPGDVILAFSDGATEAASPGGEFFGPDRLAAIASRHRSDAPQALLEHLLAEIQRFCGDGTPGDDVTMAVLRYEGAVRSGDGRLVMGDRLMG